MPKDTFYRLPEEKRNRILNAAKAEFHQVSYDEASINKIIKSADISRGSFYQYFEDKDDLFFYILEESGEYIKQSLDQILYSVDRDIFRFVYVLIEEDLLGKIDFSDLLLQDKEEQLCFLSILSAVLGDTVRKIFQQKEHFDIYEECQRMRRKLQTLERHYRK